MDDLAPVGAWLLLSGTWELDASLCCVTSIGLSGCSNQSPAIVLTDKAKIPAFLASLQLLQTKNNSRGGTKDESHSSGILWTGHG